MAKSVAHILNTSRVVYIMKAFWCQQVVKFSIMRTPKVNFIRQDHPDWLLISVQEGMWRVSGD